MYSCFKQGSSNICFVMDYAAGGQFDKFLRFNRKTRLAVGVIDWLISRDFSDRRACLLTCNIG